MNYSIIWKNTMVTSKGGPLVSVIVTTYNRKELLKETIDSILNQTFRKFELIVVDNFSDYDFFAHIESFNDDRIIAFQNSNSGIIAANRNYGINKAKGEYIAFCDDDDIWYPDKLDCQLKELHDNSSGLCFTNFDYINEDGMKLEKKHKIKKRYLKPTFNKFILGGGGICNSSVMIRREIVGTVGLFDEDSQLIAVEDYHYWARILHKYKGCCIGKKLVSYRINRMKSIQPSSKVDWFKKELYLLRSIHSLVSINKIYYYAKHIKLTAVLLLKLLKSV